MKKILIVDGNSLLYRAFYGLPPLSTKKGEFTQAIHGFLNMFLKVSEELEPSNVIICFDTKGGSFRNEMYDEYKGNRKPMPEELIEQVPRIKEVLVSMDVELIEKAGFEADDLIGTIDRLAEEKGFERIILTGDRDLLQLVRPNTTVLINTKGVGELDQYDEALVIKKMGVRADQITDYKGLCGDSADNIPGVARVGKKSAITLLSEYDTIEEVFENLEKISSTRIRNALEGNFEIAKLSKDLATIRRDVPLSLDFEKTAYDFHVKDVSVLKRYELNSFVRRFSTEQLEVPKTWDEDFSKLDLSKPVIFDFFIYQDQRLYGFYQEGITVISQELPSEQLRVIGFDLKRLFLEDIDLEKIEIEDDVMLMHYLLYPDQNSQDLQKIDHDGHLPDKSTLLDQQKIPFKTAKNTLSEMLIKRLIVIAQKHQEFLKPILTRELDSLYRNIELPLIPILADMQKVGFRVDRSYLDQFDEEISQKLEKVSKIIMEYAGETINLNSPKQLGTVLFEKLELPVIRKTKTGYSTAHDVLVKLIDEHPIVPEILHYRSLSKIKSTYIDSLRKLIAEDERIHSSFNQTIAVTGRLSSTEPNLQNIPIRLEEGRKIRRMFVASDGNVLISADYSQIELRILAHISKDEHMIEAYKNGEDIHRMTASKVFETPLNEVSSAQRSEAKAVNFGIVYGISDYGLSENLDIPIIEAKNYIDKYFEEYPKIKEYLDNAVKECEEKGYVKTLLGRIRELPSIYSKNFNQRNFAKRAAMNTPIQGTAADIIKLAMIQVYQRLKKENLKSRLILQVHDELIIDAKKDEVQKVRDILKEEMESAFKMDVPLTVNIEQGINWYEAK